MRAFDNLPNAFNGASQTGMHSNLRLLQAALALLSDNGQTGGIHGLAERFQKAGLGHVVASWIGAGENLPVSGEQIEQVFGDGALDQISEETGLTQSATASQLGDMLPELVDRLTPEGRTPEGGLGSVAELLEQVMGR